MSRVNTQWRLAARPVGAVKPSDWKRTEEPIGDPADGQVLIENLYVSLDPAMRGWLNDVRSYIPPVALGDVMRAFTAGRVIASSHAGFPVGTHVTGVLGVQRYALSDGKNVTKVDPSLAPLPVWLGALGMPGLTAYFGLLEVGRVKDGDTVLVSGAAGAVGSVVGQVAKAHGCRVVGVAGGAAKCAWVRELGFDDAIDYKAPGVDLRAAIRAACPNGVDVYFDNVGGDTLDAALLNLTRGARVVICGAVSQYNAAGAWRGPANYMSLLVNRATMTGFVVSDFLPRWGEGVKALAGMYAAGKLHTRETVIEGLDQFPRAFDALFAGENTGKMLLKL